MDAAAIGKSVTTLVLQTINSATVNGNSTDYSKLGADILKLIESPHAHPATRRKRIGFPFEELPPEIRDAIYGLALVTDRTILIVHHRYGSNYVSDIQWQWKEDKANGVDRPMRESRIEAKEVKPAGVRRRKAVADSKPNTAILRVNKQTHKEAVSLLYGANRFVFSSTSSYKHFAQEVGRHMSSLQHIEIGEIKLNTGRSNDLLMLLKDAVDIKDLKLEIVYCGRGNFASKDEAFATGAWDAIKPFVLGASFTRCEGGHAGQSCDCLEKCRLKRFGAVGFTLRTYVGSVQKQGEDVESYAARIKTMVRAKWEAETAST